jgi:hypothetical protein
MGLNTLNTVIAEKHTAAAPQMWLGVLILLPATYTAA